MLNRTCRNQVELDFCKEDERETYHRATLARLLLHARSHPLTGDRLAGASRADILSDPQEVLARVAPVRTPDHGNAVLAARDVSGPGGASIVFSTGGTTGRPVILLGTYGDSLRNAVHHGKGYWIAGVRPHHRVATFGGSGTFASEYCVYHALSQTGCTILPVNDFRRVPENVVILRNMKATVLLAMPSELYPMVDHMEAHRLHLPDVELIVTGGEPLSEQLRDRLNGVFGPVVKFGSTFQTADLGTIGFQCEHCAPSEYHVHEEIQYVQVEEVDGEPELVVTNLDRALMPALRLQSGDRASFVESGRPCLCGRTSRKIALLGRTGAVMKIGGEKVPTAGILRLPVAVRVNEHRVRIEITRSASGRDRLTVRSDEFLEQGRETAALSHLLAEPKLAQMVREGRRDRIRFEGSSDVRQNPPGTGKNRILVDLRT